MVASVTMGYGHLRAAHPIAERLGGSITHVDQAPLADTGEISLWSWVRRAHELLSKPLSFVGPLGAPMRGLMDTLTMIPPLHDPRDHREPTWSVRLLDRLIRRGLGAGMVQQLRKTGSPLVTTFYAPAIVADRAGIERVYCVVTDADCNRVWAPLDAAHTRIKYFAPSRRVVRRLRSFGVPAGNIELTGFPLPPALTDTTDTTSPKSRLAHRLLRLDPTGTFRELYKNELSMMFPEGTLTGTAGPLTLMFAVGGAGAQAEIVDQFLPSLRPKILDGSLNLRLVAGTREEVRAAFKQSIDRCNLLSTLNDEIQIVFGRDFPEYYQAFNRAFLRTDVLWTKPSELSFYPALGVPCITAPSVGSHERYNRRWLREKGVALKQRRPDLARGWLEEWLDDGVLAGSAWSGFIRLPQHGTERIVAHLTSGAAVEQSPAKDLVLETD
jgi:hypothetical protein